MPSSVLHAVILWGQVMRVGVAADGKQLLSIAGFLPDGATSLEGSAVSSSSSFLVEKLL